MDAAPVPPPGRDPATATADFQRRFEHLYERSRYLDALRFGRDCFDAPPSRWPGVVGKTSAARLAGRLGGDRLRRVLLFDVERHHIDEPVGRYHGYAHQFSRRPPAEVWLRIRDLPVGSDDPHLRAQWAALKGSVLTSLRDFDRGFDLLRQAEDLAGDQSWVHVAIAHSLETRDDTGAAESSLRRALEINPNDNAAVQSYAQRLLQRQAVDEAVEVLRRAIDDSQCGIQRLHLATIELQRQRYDLAATLTDDAERLLPMMDPPRTTAAPTGPSADRRPRGGIRAAIAQLRSDLAYHRSDPDSAIDHASATPSGFYRTLTRNLDAHRRDGRRVQLPVPFVRQDHVTCAPATLTMLCRYFDVAADHDAIVREICYDGTPSVRTRRWAEENGLAVREFTVTPDAAHALIDRGLPFALTLVGSDIGHIQVVCGYDSHRGVLLIQDPGSWHVGEALIEGSGRDEPAADETDDDPHGVLSQFEAFGPRGLVVVPIDRASELDAIELPDADLWDRAYRVDASLERNDREAAAAVVETMRTVAPEHDRTLWAVHAVATYDGDAVAQLAVVEALRERYPNDAAVLSQHVSLLGFLGRSTDAVEILRDQIRRRRAGAAAHRQLVDLLEDDADRAERRWLIRRVLRHAPHDAGGLLVESRRRWHNGDREGALELARLASMSAERDESMAQTYVAAARRLGRAEEALRVLENRFERHGDAGGGPAVTLAAALSDAYESRRAVDVLDRAVARRPDDAVLRCDAARLMLSLRGAAAATRVLDDATAALPEGDEHGVRAMIAEFDGRLADARGHREALDRIQPLNISNLESLARLLAALEGGDHAVKFLNDRVSRYPHCRTLLTATVTWLRAESRHAEAKRTLDTLLDAHPADAWARRERALVHLVQGDHDAALRDAAAALNSERSAAGHAVLADVHLAMGEFDKAREGFEAAVRDDVDQLYSMHSLWTLCRDDDERRATLELLRRELQRQRGGGEAIGMYESLARRTLSPVEIVRQFSELRDERPDAFEAALLLPDYYRETGDADRSGEALDAIAGRFDDVPGYWRAVGDLASVRKDHDAAVDAFGEAVRLNPGWTVGVQRLTSALFEAGRNADAVAEMRAMLRRRPNDPDTLLALAKHLDDPTSSDHDPAAAADLIHRAASLPAAGDPAWDALIEHHRRQGTVDRAIAVAEANVEKRPEDYQSHRRAGQVYAAFGRYAEADAALERSEKSSPDSGDVRTARVQLLIERGDLTAALEMADRPGIDPRFRTSVDVLAARLERQREAKATSRKRLKAAIDADPTSLYEWSLLADWAEEDGDDATYDEAAEQLVSRGPHIAAAFGYRHVTRLRGGDRDGAKADLRQALTLDGEYQFALDSLIKLCLKDGELDEAETVLDGVAEQVTPTVFHAYACRIARHRCDAGRWIEALERIPEPTPFVATPAADAAGEPSPPEAGINPNADINPIAVVRFALDDAPAVGATFNDAVGEAAETPGAARAVGIGWVWPRTTSLGFRGALKSLRQWSGNGGGPTNAAWNGAATALVEHACEINTSTIAVDTAKAIARLSGDAIVNDAGLWSAVVRGLIQHDATKPARKLALRFADVPIECERQLAPAMRTFVDTRRGDALTSLLERWPIPPHYSNTRTAMAALSVREGRGEDFDRWLALGDLTDVDDCLWPHAVLAMTIHRCLQRGSDQELVDMWTQQFGTAAPGPLQHLYLRGREYIARRRGRTLSALWWRLQAGW